MLISRQHTKAMKNHLPKNIWARFKLQINNVIFTTEQLDVHRPNIRDLKQRGREREQRRLRKITFLVRSLLLSEGH